jgi:hypothetical protein
MLKNKTIDEVEEAFDKIDKEMTDKQTLNPTYNGNYKTESD